MKLRIFVSSTFYDLRYIREDLANFVRSYGFEPILFEDGDIGYTPGKPLDSSCYESMRNSDMVILIVGGEYGSSASGEKKDEFNEYISVTRKEFRTAVETAIPVFTMIDKKVMAEYGVYEANFDNIENKKWEMIFPTTKNINVFRFIKEIKGIIALPIQEFEKSSDIKGFISKQWADMFKTYLSSLRNNDEIVDHHKKIFNFCFNLKKAFHFRTPTIMDISSILHRKSYIDGLLDGIKEVKEKGIFDNGFYMDSDTSKIIHRIIPPCDLHLYEFSIRYFENVYNRVDLIYDYKTRNEIVQELIKDEYFDAIIEHD